MSPSLPSSCKGKGPNIIEHRTVRYTHVLGSRFLVSLKNRFLVSLKNRPHPKNSTCDVDIWS